MLKISINQMEYLDLLHRNHFESELLSFIRHEFALQVSHVNDVQLSKICSHVVGAASKFGILDAVPIAQLVCLAIATQGKLLTQPDIVEYLSDQGLPAGQRVQLLVDELSELEPKEALNNPAPTRSLPSDKSEFRDAQRFV